MSQLLGLYDSWLEPQRFSSLAAGFSTRLGSIWVIELQFLENWDNLKLLSIIVIADPTAFVSSLLF